MAETQSLIRKTALAFLSASAALTFGTAAGAQDEQRDTITGREETLQDGQVVTRLIPGANPDAVAGERSADESQQSGVLGGSANGQSPPSVLAIVSHPDDELIFAPVLARIAREGGDVTLVFATSGDAGPGVSGLDTGKELATLREDEARCSAFSLGLEEPIFWRFGDGTLANQSRNTQSTMRDMGESIAALISVHSPDVVMSWGPDGGYGHADHRFTSNAITQVLQAMGPERPDLLYAAFPATEQGEQDAGALPGFEGWARIHPSLVTDRIAYQPLDLDAAMAAVNCYESQFDPAARRMLAGTLHQQLWRGKVAFRMAFARQN